MSFAQAVQAGAMVEPDKGEPEMPPLLAELNALGVPLTAIVEHDLYPTPPDVPPAHRHPHPPVLQQLRSRVSTRGGARREVAGRPATSTGAAQQLLIGKGASIHNSHPAMQRRAAFAEAHAVLELTPRRTPSTHAAGWSLLILAAVRRAVARRSAAGDDRSGLDGRQNGPGLLAGARSPSSSHRHTVDQPRPRSPGILTLS